MDSILCHLGSPRTSKPESHAEYGRIRERMILNPWVCLPEEDFIEAVTRQGCPFHGALMNGIDLHEMGSEVLIWRMQTLIGLDFDKCPISGEKMVNRYSLFGIRPWLGYYTFSHVFGSPLQSYRLLWRAECDLNAKRSDVTFMLKRLFSLSEGHADKHAANATRLWQGTNSGHFHYYPAAKRISFQSTP